MSSGALCSGCTQHVAQTSPSCLSAFSRNGSEVKLGHGRGEEKREGC